MTINTVSLIGAGAVGAFYGSRLSHFLGTDKVRFIADEKRIKRYENDGIFINGERQPLTFVTPDTDVTPADLVIVATKNTQLAEAVDAIRKHVGTHTAIISLLNGVDSEEVLAQAYGEEKILYSYVNELGSRHDGKNITVVSPGHIALGEKNNKATEQLVAITSLLRNAGISVVTPDDILHALWYKFALNTMYNSLTALTRSSLGEMRDYPETKACLDVLFQEVVLAARTRNVILNQEDLDSIRSGIARMPFVAWTSMRQDIEAGRRTENQWFCGTVARIGREHGFPTPFATTLASLLAAYEVIRTGQVRALGDGQA